MRALRIVAAAAAVAIGALGLHLMLAGVTLSLENQSGEAIREVQIRYGRDSLAVTGVGASHVFSKRLGKIGEGGTFDVRWVAFSGEARHSQFTVYFEGSSGRERVRIRFLTGGRSELIYRDRVYPPDNQLSRLYSQCAAGASLASPGCPSE